MSKSDGPKVVVALYAFKGKNNDEVCIFTCDDFFRLKCTWHGFKLVSFACFVPLGTKIFNNFTDAVFLVISKYFSLIQVQQLHLFQVLFLFAFFILETEIVF